MGEEADILLPYAQAVKIMAVSVMLRDEELHLSGDDEDDAKAAMDALIDAGQEIAIQIGGY